MKLCVKLGILIQVHKLDEHRTDNKIMSKVKSLLNDQKVGGGIGQLSLPRQSLSGILNLISLEEDIDILSRKAQKRYYYGEFRLLSPFQTRRSWCSWLSIPEKYCEGVFSI